VNGENAPRALESPPKFVAELHAAASTASPPATTSGPARDHSYIAQTSACCGRSTFRPAPRLGRQLFETGKGLKSCHQRHVPAVHDPLDDPFRTAEAEVAKYMLGRMRTSSWSTCMARRPARSSRWHFFDAASRPCWARTAHSDRRFLGAARRHGLPDRRRHVRRLRFGDWHEEEGAVLRFIKKVPGDRLAPAEGEGTMCAALVETDDKTGLARRSGRSGSGALPPAA